MRQFATEEYWDEQTGFERNREEQEEREQADFLAKYKEKGYEVTAERNLALGGTHRWIVRNPDGERIAVIQRDDLDEFYRIQSQHKQDWYDSLNDGLLAAVKTAEATIGPFPQVIGKGVDHGKANFG